MWRVDTAIGILAIAVVLIVREIARRRRPRRRVRITIEIDPDRADVDSPENGPRGL